MDQIELYVSTATIASGGDDQFLFKDSTSFSRLIKISREFNGWNIEDRWRTDICKIRTCRVYIITGFSLDIILGFFVVWMKEVENYCGVPAARDGFLIVVDEHLIVVTKQGKLSVAPASASGISKKLVCICLTIWFGHLHHCR